MEELKTIPLLVSFLLVWMCAYGVAWFFRHQYDILKPLVAYAIIATCICIASIFWQVPWILCIGLFIFGFIVLIFRNQTYFDK